MPDPRSALASVVSGAVKLSAELSAIESGFADLVSVSAWPDTEVKVFAAVAELLEVELPSKCRDARHSGELTIFRIAPRKIMIVSENMPLFPGLSALISGEDGSVTELAHSRTRVRLGGHDARALLARGAAVDLAEDVFTPASFAQTTIHQIPVLLHRTEGVNDEFDLYVLRSYALSFWHWLVETARIAGKAPDTADILAY